jgi:hypothetical protein
VLGQRDGFSVEQAYGSSWAVGTGQMNWVPQHCPQYVSTNPTSRMLWAPIYNLSATDIGGVFRTGLLTADPGDSGGPVYRIAKTPTPSKMRLVLLGILSHETAINGCNLGGFNNYTSVEYADNFDWIVSQGGSPTPPPDVASFGASL